MATEIAMLGIKSENLGSSAALRDAIPIMELLNHMKEMKNLIQDYKVKVHCKLYGDSSGALEILWNKPGPKNIYQRSCTTFATMSHREKFRYTLFKLTINKLIT
jgi:hypothetical protein